MMEGYKNIVTQDKHNTQISNITEDYLVYIVQTLSFSVLIEISKLLTNILEIKVEYTGNVNINDKSISFIFNVDREELYVNIEYIRDIVEKIVKSENFNDLLDSIFDDKEDIKEVKERLYEIRKDPTEGMKNFLDDVFKDDPRSIDIILGLPKKNPLDNLLDDSVYMEEVNQEKEKLTKIKEKSTTINKFMNEVFQEDSLTFEKMFGEQKKSSTRIKHFIYSVTLTLLECELIKIDNIRDLSELIDIIRDNRDEIRDRYRIFKPEKEKPIEYYGGGGVTTIAPSPEDFIVLVDDEMRFLIDDEDNFLIPAA
jgi:hypothetical protein